MNSDSGDSDVGIRDLGFEEIFEEIFEDESRESRKPSSSLTSVLVSGLFTLISRLLPFEPFASCFA